MSSGIQQGAAPTPAPASHQPQQLLTDHLDLWTTAVRHKSTAGRGSNRKIELAGINKLRELILELAVRGKLVPQNPDDEPASELLKRIEAEKAQLVKDGRLKKQKPLPAVTDEEKPFELPQGWEWSHLPELYNPISPSNKKLKTSLINEAGRFPVVDQGQEFIRGYYDDESLVISAKERPVILFGDHTKVIKLIDFDFIPGADGTKILEPIKIDPRFFYIQLTGYKLDDRGYGRHFKLLNCSFFALPPLAEQQRIVAKVDELMTLCDQLEQQSEHQLDAHQQLTETLLSALLTPAAGALTNATSAQELSDNWQRLAQHFDLLFSGPMGAWAIDRLKDTTLQLAVMGKLVPQNPDDEPAAELLKRIDAEKARLVKEGKIKKQKPLPPVSDDEKPFELPQEWEWVRFDNLIRPESVISYGVLVPGPDVDDGVPFVRIEDLSLNSPSTLPNKRISVDVDSKYERTRLQGGEILMGVVGSIGKLGITPVTWKGANIARAVCRIDPTPLISKEYVITILQSQFMQESFSGDTRTLAQPTLNIGLIRTTLTPLPPLAEQQRIVAKVDELFTLCDQLKERLQHASDTQLNLTDALVEQALS